ncbi:surfeit locus protein 1 [Octopus bimaculoides]|uniref:SURF1-like protein n=1 Tax=Octopus bimaculoides TaxID=37653 RepID=A0A0L8HZD6_OCTBM|nr:surfeit locus protein 1 [Octopus bimaculoides]|eukprot:XP_014768077.1 PREDICTED: surfeit locus protein 1-like [Octopus bimaculoides]
MVWNACLRLLSQQPKRCSVLKSLSLKQFSSQVPRLKPYVSKKKSGPSGYVLLIIPITTFGLGTWQIRRREWKLNLIKMLEDRTMADPIPLPENLEELEDLEYCRIRVKGRFIHKDEFAIAPRSNFIEDSDHKLLTHDASKKVGMNIITPFKLSDRDMIIMVNRGWIPMKKKSPATRPKGQIEDEVEIVGVVRRTDPPRMMTPSNDPKTHGYWMLRDIESMAEACGSSPVFIDADIHSTVPGGPLGGQTKVTLRNEHLTYIFTWYTLSAITAWMWYRMFRRPPPPQRPADIVINSRKFS